MKNISFSSLVCESIGLE